MSEQISNTFSWLKKKIAFNKASVGHKDGQTPLPTKVAQIDWSAQGGEEQDGMLRKIIRKWKIENTGFVVRVIGGEMYQILPKHQQNEVFLNGLLQCMECLQFKECSSECILITDGHLPDSRNFQHYHEKLSRFKVIDVVTASRVNGEKEESDLPDDLRKSHHYCLKLYNRERVESVGDSGGMNVHGDNLQESLIQRLVELIEEKPRSKIPVVSVLYNCSPRSIRQISQRLQASRACEREFVSTIIFKHSGETTGVLAYLYSIWEKEQCDREIFCLEKDTRINNFVKKHFTEAERKEVYEMLKSLYQAMESIDVFDPSKKARAIKLDHKIIKAVISSRALDVKTSLKLALYLDKPRITCEILNYNGIIDVKILRDLYKIAVEQDKWEHVEVYETFGLTLRGSELRQAFVDALRPPVKKNNAMCLWQRQKYPMATALSAAMVLKDFAGKAHAEREKKFFNQLADEFESQAVAVLEECYHDSRYRADDFQSTDMNARKTDELVCKEVEIADLAGSTHKLTGINHSVSKDDDKTNTNQNTEKLIKTCCVQLAVEGKCLEYVSHPAVQHVFDDLWYIKHDTDEKLKSSSQPLLQTLKSSPKRGLQRVYYIHLVYYVVFLGLFSHIVLSEFHATSRWSWAEIALHCWMITVTADELSQIVLLNAEFVFNFDNVMDYAMTFTYFVAIVLRFCLPVGNIIPSIFICVSLLCVYVRSLHLFLHSKRMGPMLIIIKELLKELPYFLTLVAGLVIAYGIIYQTLMYAPSPSSFPLMYSLLRASYWPIYGEVSTFLEDIEANECTFDNSTGIVTGCPLIRYAMPALLGAYILILNVLMFNLLIAIFSDKFTKLYPKCYKLWAYGRYYLIREYSTRSTFPPPINLVEIFVKCLKYMSSSEKSKYWSSVFRLPQKKIKNKNLDAWERICAQAAVARKEREYRLKNQPDEQCTDDQLSERPLSGESREHCCRFSEELSVFNRNSVKLKIGFGRDQMEAHFVNTNNSLQHLQISVDYIIELLKRGDKPTPWTEERTGRIDARGAEYEDIGYAQLRETWPPPKTKKRPQRRISQPESRFQTNVRSLQRSRSLQLPRKLDDSPYLQSTGYVDAVGRGVLTTTGLRH